MKIGMLVVLDPDRDYQGIKRKEARDNHLVMRVVKESYYERDKWLVRVLDWPSPRFKDKFKEWDFAIPEHMLLPAGGNPW